MYITGFNISILLLGGDRWAKNTLRLLPTKYTNKFIEIDRTVLENANTNTARFSYTRYIAAVKSNS